MENELEVESRKLKVESVALGEVAVIERVAADVSILDDVHYVGLEDIDKTTGEITLKRRELPKSSKFAFSSEHVLYGKLRPNLRKVARPAFDGICSTDILPIKPTNRLHKDYLYHYMRTQSFTAKAMQLAVGVNLPRLSPKQLSTFDIPLPPFPFQQRIAAILDAADALRAKRRESLQQLDQLLQSTFLEMFGDPVTNPMGWDRKPMGQFMRIRRGGSPRPIDKYLGGSINWIKIGDATRSGNDLYITSCAEKITEDGLNKTTLLEPGSFVFANSGVSLGFARILKIQGAIHDGWLAFDEYDRNVLDELFFLKALNGITQHFRRIAPSGTQPNLNTGIMKAFKLILPPIEEQQRFSKIVKSIEQQKNRCRAQLDKLDTLFASLQSRAFNGAL